MSRNITDTDRLIEERPLIEFPTLVKLFIMLGSFLIGVSLLVLPWYIALALFVVFAGMVAIFFDPYTGLIAFLVGALLHPLEYLSAYFSSMHVSTVLAVCILFIWVFHIIVYRDFKIVHDKMNVLVVLFGIDLFISTFTYFDFSFPQFIDFVKLLILYFLVINLVRTKNKYLIIMWCLVFFGTIACFVGLYQHARGIGVDYGEGVVRITGTALDPNDYAMHLVILVPIIFALLFNYRNFIVKGILVFVLALFILNIVFTYSRGGMIAFGLVLVFSVLGFSVQRKKVLLPLVLILLGALVLVPIIPEKYWERAKSITDFRDPAIQARLDTWKTGLGMIADHPVKGVGLGAFRYEYISRAYMSTDVKTRVAFFSHNAYIQIGAEVGIPALVIFMLLLAFSIADLARTERYFLSKGDMLFAGFSLSLKLGLLGYIICAIFLTQAFLTMFWIILPLVIVTKMFTRESEMKDVR